MRSRSLWAALAGLTFLAAGCGSDDEGSLASLPTEAEAAAAPEAAPPTDVARIDAAYISQTMQRLENVRAEVRRSVLATKQFTEADQAKLNAIFTDPALDAQSRLWRDTESLDVTEFKPAPGPALYPVEEIRLVRPDCIWFKTHPNESAAANRPSQGVRGDIVLKTLAHDRALNPSPWVIKHYAPDGYLDESLPCESTSDELR